VTKPFKRGDHVEWNSEAGIVRGVIVKKVVSDTLYKGYVHHASKKQPQYLIKSDKTDHVAIHKGAALKHIKARTRKTSAKGKRR
jgi:Hypervirulence associated proteins TUDOR domain